MAMIKVALVSQTRKISHVELRHVAAAFDRQVREHFTPLWHLNAQVKAFRKPGDVPTDHWPVTIRDQIEAEGAISYHSVNKGRPFVEVSYTLAEQYASKWTFSASHDLLEMLVDPNANRTIKAPAIVPGKNYDVTYPVQVCDPCANARYGYEIEGVLVADFTTPDYWLPRSRKKGKYSFTGALTRPFQVLPGGYLNWQDPKTKKWNIFIGESEAAAQPETGPAKRKEVSRTRDKGGVRFQNPALARFYEGLAGQRESTASVVRGLIEKFTSRRRAAAWTELHAKTLDDLYTILNSLSDTQAYVFRGQASSKWKSLQPSLHRSLGDTPEMEDSVMKEAMAIRAFRRHARSLLHPSEMVYFDRILDSITLMQHYGAPTRLLDWTLSPWVACYFAVQTDEDKNDAAIWTFNWDELAKYNHQHLGSKGYQNFGRLESATSVEDWANAARTSGPFVKVFRYEYANPQMSAQQSLFTVAGKIGDNHNDALERCLKEPWQRLKVIIPKSEKEKLRRRLFTMNVSPLALFPTPDGVGRNIREAMQSKLSLGDESLLWSLDEMARRSRLR
jgi:hypothetical protein